MKKVFIYFFACLGLVLNVSAQLPSISMKTPCKAKGYPTQQTIEDISRGNILNMDMLEAFWDVFSDRSDNATYEAPNSKKTKEVLGFLERVTIAETKGEWAHVYQETYVQRFPIISNQAKDLGWIKLENLIISEFALKNNNKFTVKAFLFNNKNEDNSILVSENPIKKSEYYLKNQVYFVLKILGDKYLLSKSDIVFGGQSDVKQAIIGWVDRRNVFLFESRMSIEPNWHLEAITEYNNKKIYFYPEVYKREAEYYYLTGVNLSEKEFQNTSLKLHREDGYLYRYFVIDWDRERNLYKVAVLRPEPEKSYFAWVPKKIKGYSNDMFQSVLFFSREEFVSYINTCLEIRRLGTGRSGYQEAFIQQLSRISGDKVSKEVVLNYTINSTWEQLFGYEYQDKEIGKLKISDLTTPTIFTDAMFTRFHERFDTKLDGVREFVSKTYPFSFESNNRQYYWVPLEDLP